ncbi:MAG TPA: 50S ribosomal protein L25 [Candidatus Gastranaerophilales bacterium]|nr:50S ribosomal protein L25 [Candidatus Gastranaerophilales bacterium]
MSKSSLTAQKRNSSLNPRQLRSSGKIPATIYGHGMESVSIELDVKEFVNTYKKDKNAIFSLNLGNESFDSIVKKVQKKSLKDDILNVEFQRISTGEKIKMVIPIKITGESKAVKEGGSLTINLTEIEVDCLPSNIPSSITVDISQLEKLEDAITIKTINYPAGVHPIFSPDMVVVKVGALKSAGTAEEGQAATAE